MEIMRALKEQGTSIIFITHKLREVKAVGDRISVIRRGKVVGTVSAGRLRGRARRDDGRPRGQPARREGRRRSRRAPCSTSRTSRSSTPRGHQVVKDVSFDARAGEVLGIAGVQGNGQTELIKSLLGLIKPDAGAIRLDGKDISKHGPRESLEDGIGYIPEDRSHDGFVEDVQRPREPRPRPLPHRRVLARAGPAPRRDRRQRPRPDRGVRHPHRVRRARRCRSLSGGNQQKVVVAREFSRAAEGARSPRSRPAASTSAPSSSSTSGSSTSATAAPPSIIVSTELDEIFALSDRIAVMYDGRIVGIVPPDIAREEIGLLMAGAHEPAEGVSA